MIQTLVTAVLVSCVVASLGGCAGAPSISASASDRAKISSARINPTVEITPKPFYQGREQSFAFIGGAVGAVVAGQAAAGAVDAQTAIVTAMRNQRVDIGEIVRAEFARAAEAGTPMRFTTDTASAVDGVVLLKVDVWGLGQTQGLSATLFPTFGVSATLRRTDGTVVWQKYEYVTPLSKENSEGHTLEEYLANPELLRKAFTSASGIVSRMLIADYRG